MNDFGYPMPRYFQDMPQIGKDLNNPMEDNAAQMKQIEADIAAEIERSTNAGTPDEKLHQRGLLTPMERLEQLIDPGTWCPMNSLYNPYENKDGSTAILTGLAKISDRWSIVIVSDHKKMAGVWVGGRRTSCVRRWKWPISCASLSYMFSTAPVSSWTSRSE